MRVTC